MENYESQTNLKKKTLSKRVWEMFSWWPTLIIFFLELADKAENLEN